MKSVIFLFIIALSSCHVHYHIQGKEISVKEDDTKPLIISGSARLYNGDFKSSCYPGCLVIHGGDKNEGVPKIISGEGLKIYKEPNNSMITVYPEKLPSQYSYDKIDTTNIYTFDNIGFHHAAGELSEKEKANFKTLNDTLK